MGYDPGVSFRSAVYPDLGITLVIPSNKGAGPEKLMIEIEGDFNYMNIEIRAYRKEDETGWVRCRVLSF